MHSKTSPLLAIVLLAGSADAQATPPVQRCVTPEGRTVYTDRRCTDLGAADRVPRTRGGGSRLAGDGRFYTGGCPRTLSALVAEIGASVQSGNVNRLASIYDWSGMSDASARRVLDRLDAVVARPLVDIVPVMPSEPVLPADTPSTNATTGAAAAAGAVAGASAEPAPGSTHGATMPAAATGQAAWLPSWNPPAPASAQDSVANPAATAGAPAASTTPRRPRPVALRVEQTLAGTATPTRTVFGLRRSYGCFWISL